MSGSRVKETMEQIHISDEMQEQIILHVESQMKRKKRRMGKRGRLAVAAAVLLTVCIVGIPVQACVRSFIMARMEAIREEEVLDIVRMVQERDAEADSFSREFSDSEAERMTRLLQSYAEGRFPEKTIRLAEYKGEMPEGTLYYVVEAGYFNLPEREMTDEELLQIIDFNKVRNYALSQTPAGQEARREYLDKQEKLREQVAAGNGISGEEAAEIATARMEARMGAQAEAAERSYIYLEDIAKLEIIAKKDYRHKSDVAYVVVLHSGESGFSYVCWIDSADGRILEAGTDLPYARHILDE